METGNVRFTLGGAVTPTVRQLLWLNGWVWFFLLLVRGNDYSEVAVGLLGLSPEAVRNHRAYWQPVTYLFVHREFLHLALNMLALWWFGSDLERVWGGRKFLRYYLFTGIGAGLVSLFLGIPTIGASGAVYGLLLAYGLLFPERVLYLYFVVPVKAKYCVLLFGAVELAAILAGSGGGVNNAAHLSGLLFGLLWFGVSRREAHLTGLFRLWKRKRMRRKFRVIRPDAGDGGPFPPHDDRTIH